MANNIWQSSRVGWLIVATLAVACAFRVGLGQEPRVFFVNQHARELASNGAYQFFAAFRNNEIDYQQFYASLSLAEVDALVRSEGAEPNADFVSDARLDIHRLVRHPGVSRDLNIVLIMVESLRA